MHKINFYLFVRWSLLWITSLCFVYADNLTDCDSLQTITSHKVKIIINPEGSFSYSDTVKLKRISNINGRLCLKISPIVTIKSISHKDELLEYSRERGKVLIKDNFSKEENEIIFECAGELGKGTEFSRITRNQAIIRLEEIFPSTIIHYNFVRVTLVIPSNWESVGPGDMVYDTIDQNNRISIWQCDKPIPMLGWVCAAEYTRFQHENRDISFTTLLFADDSVFSSQTAKLSENVIQYFGEKFVPYRFRSFTVVEVDNWVAGNSVLAIASPGFVMVKKFAFTTEDKFNRVESILAHEIAHQWWPLTVFLYDEDMPFLSEGLCEHSARWYNKFSGQESGRDSLGNHPLLRPLFLKILRGEDAPLRQKKDMRYSQTHYLKGAYVHHMLQDIIGERKAEILYKLYAQKFYEKKSNIYDFITIAESLAGKKLEWFFDQWLNRTNIPRLKIYNVKLKMNGNIWICEGRIRLLGYEKFSTFATVRAEGKNSYKEDTVFIGTDVEGRYNNDTPFRIEMDEKPERIILDPLNNILKFRKLPPKLSDLREPLSGTMIIGTKNDYDNLRKCAERDSAEMTLAGWNIRIIRDTAATLSDMQRSYVFLYGKPAQNQLVESNQSKFPFKFQGDSLIINGEEISDNSLTFIQVIDNPYLENGLLVWIAPFGFDVPAKLLPYDASWILLKGKEEIAKGIWEVYDEDIVFEMKSGS